MEIIFILTCFIFSVLVFAAICSSAYQKEIIIEKRLSLFFWDKVSNQHVKNAGVEKNDMNSNRFSFNKRILNPLWKRLQSVMSIQMSTHSTSNLEIKLREAGRPFQLSPVDFRLIQLLLGLGISLSMMFFLSSSPFSFKNISLAIFAGCIGAIYPNAYLKRMKKERIKKIEKSMPDFFDTVTLALEAGMGLDAALAKVCRKVEGPLSEEMLLTIEDMKLGNSRRQAFSNLRERIASDLFQSVITQIIQADQLGIGIVKVLRAQTNRIREQRMQLAREQAMKAPVKMLIPMVLFIFPTLFIVLLGPLVITVVTSLR
jgi:tight adherence protein C